jgi:hypothetical protein
MAKGIWILLIFVPPSGFALKSTGNFPTTWNVKTSWWLAIRKGEAISPIEIEKYLKLSDKTVKKVLSQLVDKKMLIPASGIMRIRSYRLGDQVKHPI